MKLSFLAVLTTLFCSALTARADIAWERNYDAALAKSRATGKPLFIDFYTDWCGWCKKLDADVYPDARVQRLSSGFVMLKLDAEREGASAARAFGVTGYPTLIFVTASAQPAKIGGYVPADQFAAAMQQVLQSVPTPKNVDKKPVTSRPTAGAIAFRQQTLLRRAKSSANYGGAFLLDENGVVALDVPAKKTKKRVKTPVKTAKKPRKSPGY